MGEHMAHKTCGFTEVTLFVFALIGGTLCSLTSKVLLTMKGVGMTNEEEDFSYPLFQTFGMFLGMTGALALHFAVLRFKIPFPGYTHSQGEWDDDEDRSLLARPSAGSAKSTTSHDSIPLWKYCQLVIPSIFDLVATCLAMFGLRHVSVSIYQMLRGSAIIFVALLKQLVLGHKLHKYKWVGIAYNVISIILVGFTAMLISSGEDSNTDSSADASTEGKFVANPLLGVLLILCGAFVQSLQYVFEEMVMSAESDIPIPPLLLIGMEGFWGTVICLFILYPIAYQVHGEDHGSFENPFNTYAMIMNTPSIQAVFTLYFFSVLLYNVLALLVTFMLDSVWHAILDNFRPITVWGLDLFIFYCVTQSFGESWSVEYSWLQLLGMGVLLYGTGIYNAPNPGSIQLLGRVWDCYLDFSDEYAEVSKAEDAAAIADSSQTPSKASAPYYSGMSPFVAMSPAMQDRANKLKNTPGANRSAQKKYELTHLSTSAQKPNRTNYGGIENA